MSPSESQGLRRGARWAGDCQGWLESGSGALLLAPPLVSWLFLCLLRYIRSLSPRDQPHLPCTNAPAPTKPTSLQGPPPVSALVPHETPSGIFELTSQNNALMDDSLPRPTATSAPPAPPIHVRAGGRCALSLVNELWVGTCDARTRRQNELLRCCMHGMDLHCHAPAALPARPANSK